MQKTSIIQLFPNLEKKGFFLFSIKSSKYTKKKKGHA